MSHTAKGTTVISQLNLPLTIASLPAVVVLQPQPYDLVDESVQVAGIGSGFEGCFSARLRDGTGQEVGSLPIIKGGGTGMWGNFQVHVPLDRPPCSAHGTLEVFEESIQDGSEVIIAVIPIVFGCALIVGYHGFAQHIVAHGETLAQIAEEWYAATALWSCIFDANRHQLADPNGIVPGQVLRIPQ